jgi:hypothetical protein
MTIKTALCAVPYEITEQDGQVIFEERAGFYGTHSRFTLEWTGCGWYLVDFDDWRGQIFAPHIVAALKWVKANYTITYNNGVGTASLNPKLGSGQ